MKKKISSGAMLSLVIITLILIIWAGFGILKLTTGNVTKKEPETQEQVYSVEITDTDKEDTD